MKFEWDRKKELLNKAKHGISFTDAKTVFDDPFHLSIEDPLHSDNEDRWITLGNCRDTAIVVVCHTYRDDAGDEVIRIISARQATPKEKRQYFRR